MTATFKPGDKVRATIDATVIEAIPLRDGVILLELAYEGAVGERNTCALPLDAPAVTVRRTDMDTEPITVFDFSARVRNCLNREGIRTVGELTACDENDLMDLRSFGDVCLAEVLTALAARGLALRNVFAPRPAERDTQTGGRL